MTTIAPPNIACPVCESHGDMLHHDTRAPLVYSCKNCLHEWEINPGAEVPHADPAVTERPRMPWVRGEPRRQS